MRWRLVLFSIWKIKRKSYPNLTKLTDEPSKIYFFKDFLPDKVLNEVKYKAVWKNIQDKEESKKK
jgi:hypothetical protein